MVKLTTETYFKLQRDEDGRIEDSGVMDRLFTMAQRWHPDIEEWPIGGRILQRLYDGDSISLRHMDQAVDYLLAALRYYSPGGPPEPYPGRDNEAYNDLEALYLELSEAMEHTA